MELKTIYNSTKFIERDKLNRSVYKKQELVRNLLLSITKDQHLPISTRLKASMQLQELNGFRNSIHNRCIITGRGRGVLRAYRLSRVIYRKFAVNGYLPGINKAAW